MGTETAAYALYALEAAVTVGGAMASRSQAKKARADQKDAQATQRNEQRAQDALTRRNALREERIRRAQILQSAQNSGAAGSSGEASAISTLASSIGANFSNMAMNKDTANAVTIFDQAAQDHTDKANLIDSITGMIGGAAGSFGDSAMRKAEANRQNPPTPNTTVTPEEQYKPN